MPSFVHESLLWWGLPLVGLPILIHLINLMRHHRVKWAAMEFLLQSQQRHQKSVLFKQLLLLLLRMAAIAAVVLMLAQPLVRNQWGAIFGGSKTHHIVLLDDSFSMSDHWADTSGFEQAKQVVERLAAQAGHQDTPQIFTLLRFSRARRLVRGTHPDLVEEPVDANFPARLDQVLGPLRTSETAAEPADALEAVDYLPPKAQDEDRVIYIVSDFRAKDWQEPVALRKSLRHLDESGAQIHLVNCVDAMHPNLAIAALRPGPGTRAAGVPLLVEVSLRNFGSASARQVSVSLEEDDHARPAIVFEDVPAGKLVTRRFPVLFTTAGGHEITARLQTDAVATDNVRSLVIDVPKAVDVLVIDGDAKGQDAFFLATALAPGGKITSGLRPLIESARYLRDHPLDSFETIYLLNIARLDPAEIAAIEAYAKAGGGVGFFLGDLSRAEFFNNELYRDGQGLFPLPLAGPAELLIDRLEKSPDLEVTDHPIFSVFAGERNSFLNTVAISRYFAAQKDWAPSSESSTRVIARLRNKAPFAVEHKFGEGRVVAILTKASPLETSLGSWNNWGRDNPSYVVAMLEMQSYLSLSRHPDATRLVGTPLDVPVDVAQYLPQVRFLMPREAGGGSVAVDAGTSTAGHVATLSDTDTSGIYQAQLTGTDATQRVERFAFNIDPDEGDLHQFNGEQLASQLDGIRYQFHQAGDIHYNPQQLAGVNLSESLLYLSLLVLLAEQLLAYAASYHSSAKEGTR
ncbi:MAG: BatA domain-containing protein [Planctomycetia bacterium]|nr:BatA domain-containing protein [Planctomycetia bacterium]